MDKTIAGFFNQFNEDGSVDITQLENLFAFTMAIEEINNRNDILPNHNLKYIIRSGIGFGAAASAALDISSNYPEIIGAVAGVRSIEIDAIDRTWAEKKIVLAHAMGQDTAFGDGNVYPYKVQTCPIDSFQGMVLQDIMCNYYNYTRLGVFATDDDFGIHVRISKYS